MKYTTLAKIRAKRPCTDGWKILLKHLKAQPSDDRRISFKTILKSNGIKDAIWCLRTLPKDDIRLFAADVAGSVLHIFEAKYPTDQRPKKAIEATRKGVGPAAYAADAAAYAAADAAAADAAAAAAAYAAADAAAAYADSAAYAARAKKWQEIEQLFIKHFY